MSSAHVGIYIYDATGKKTWFDHNGEKYFVPASNVKLATAYTALKILGDSLPGVRYAHIGNSWLLEGTGDPTFLHRDFVTQPVLNFLQSISASDTIYLSSANWRDQPLGEGWSWDDYNDDYMAERSSFPIYGNTVRFSVEQNSIQSHPKFFKDSVSVPKRNLSDSMLLTRQLSANQFNYRRTDRSVRYQEVPFLTRHNQTAVSLLSDTLRGVTAFSEMIQRSGTDMSQIIYSQRLDSVLRPMLHRSDNFFAEQLLLMVSDQKLHVMNDALIIDSLLRSELHDLPQPPTWVDGSGLSRYNLFSPQDFVHVLRKMLDLAGRQRIQQLLPTGGQGTMQHYFLADSGYVFAKTGSLSGVVALSGILYTRKGKQLIFSVLVNNNRGSSSSVRREVEQFLETIRKKY